LRLQPPKAPPTATAAGSSEPTAQATCCGRKISMRAGFVGIVNSNDAGSVLLGSLTSNGNRYATLTKVDSAGRTIWNYNYSSSQAQINILNSLITTGDGGYAATGLIPIRRPTERVVSKSRTPLDRCRLTGRLRCKAGPRLTPQPKPPTATC
jgi:hypothetical protein